MLVEFLPENPAHRNVLVALLTVVYVKVVVGTCDFLVSRNLLAPKVSRKVVHVAAGSWIVFWPLFSEEHPTWKLNVLVPVVYSAQLLVKGAILRDRNDPDVRTMTRTGNPTELLNGPLCFTLLMTAVGLAGFRTPLGVLIMACLGFGDGIAPLVGTYFPFGSYPTVPFGPRDRKTLSGSLACFVGALVGYACLRFVIDEQNDDHGFAGSDDEWPVVVRVAAAVAVTEGICGPYDNVAIPLATALAYKRCLAKGE